MMIKLALELPLTEQEYEALQREAEARGGVSVEKCLYITMKGALFELMLQQQDDDNAPEIPF